MARIYVQLTGLDHAIGLKADKVDRDATKNRLIVKDSQGNVVGEFELTSVAGWWIGD